MTEYHEKITSIFSSKVALEHDVQEALCNRWTHKVNLKRNDFLAQPGQVESKLFYVVSGTMRIYFPNAEEEVCVGFAYDNSLICSYPSFIQQQPSAYFIQALSNTSLLAIARTDFYNLFNEHRSLERAWRMLEEEALLGKIEREVEMLTYSPEERYQRLLKRSPHLFQLVPRKYIASYLRMTPETLSRIRA